MFCCAEMRCWRNDVCAMCKMMCRCAAMEGESSQGELFCKTASVLALSVISRCSIPALPKGEPLAKPVTLQLSWKRTLSACSLHSQPAPPKEELFAICR